MSLSSRDSLNKASRLPSEKLGAWFEQEAKKIFAHLQSNHRVYFHRFPDSKAAGTLIGPQPADFLLAGPSGAYLVELKASAKAKTLVSRLSALFKKEKTVPLRLWDRAGHRSLFIFLAVPSGTVEIWDGAYVAERRRLGKKLEDSEVLTRFFADRFESILLSILTTSAGQCEGSNV